MDNETLQAIQKMLIEEREHTSRMMDGKLKAELQPIKDDIRQIKRDTSITRVAVNSLIEWVDEAREVTGISYPNK